MEVKKLIYDEKDNINKLVKCLEKDKIHLRNIPHQPGEFSAKPFKLTTKCVLIYSTRQNLNFGFILLYSKKESSVAQG